MAETLSSVFWSLRANSSSLRYLADGALAGIDVVGQFLYAGDGLVGVVIECGIFEQLPAVPLPAFRSSIITFTLSTVPLTLLYSSSSENSLPSVPLPWCHLIHQSLEFTTRAVQPVVQRGIVQQLADRSLAALDEGHDAVETL